MTRAAYIRNVTVIVIAGFACAPLLVGAQAEELPPVTSSDPYQYQSEGIFGCNQISGAAMSVGTLSAIGGVYVPVNDAAVTLNTGILVYKECALRPLLNRLKENATAGILKKQVTSIETGRQGNKQYVENPSAELLQTKDKAALSYLTGGSLNNVNPAFKKAVETSLARNHIIETRGSGTSGCSYQGDLGAALTNPTTQPFSFSNFEQQADPACNPYFEYVEKKNELDAYKAEAAANQQMIWDWGRGYYAVTDNAEDPLAERVLTPSSVVQESFQQILGSPVRQLESANDVGQMIGALFSGVTTQITTDIRGLAGLTQGVGGQPSYLDRVVKESSAGVLSAAVNAALQILRATRQVEAAYLGSMNAIVVSLTQAISQLRAVENQCWALIVPKAREHASGAGFQLDENKIRNATSSQAFSKQVIDSQIASLATTSTANVASSQRALQLIDQLIAGVTDVSSLNAQRLALQQLDALIAQKLLHTQYDAQRAAQQQEDVKNAMDSLVADTAVAWGDSPDPAVGWCNVNNPDVPRLWAERWRR